MSSATLAWVTVGVVLTVVVAEDPNVLTYLALLSRRATQVVQAQWVRLRYHPDSPWVRAEVKRNSERLARELRKELGLRDEE